MSTEEKTTVEETKEEVKLSPPWITKYKEINSLFGADPEIEVVYDNDTHTVTIESVNSFKIAAIEKIIKPTFIFGNVTLTIKCLVKDSEEENLAVLFRTALSGNPHLAEVLERKVLGTIPETYVIFNKEVIQFYNDDTTDFFGNWNGLAEDILRDVMKDGFRINIGTDEEDVSLKWDEYFGDESIE